MPIIRALQIPEMLPPDRFNRLLESVDPERRERILRFRRREDALRCLFGGLLVRAVLSRTSGVRPRDILLSRDAQGKPNCLFPAHIHFNLSHSGCWVLAAFDDVPVGVDIEEMKPVNPEVPGLVFSPAEIRTMESLAGNERLSYFYETWTLKESWLKASGRGISDSLADLTVIPGEKPFRYRLQNSRIMDSAFLSLVPGVDPDYRAAVCSSRDDSPAAVVRENAEELAAFFLRDRS